MALQNQGQSVAKPSWANRVFRLTDPRKKKDAHEVGRIDPLEEGKRLPHNPQNVVFEPIYENPDFSFSQPVQNRYSDANKQVIRQETKTRHPSSRTNNGRGHTNHRHQDHSIGYPGLGVPSVTDHRENGSPLGPVQTTTSPTREQNWVNDLSLIANAELSGELTPIIQPVEDQRHQQNYAAELSAIKQAEPPVEMPGSPKLSEGRTHLMDTGGSQTVAQVQHEGPTTTSSQQNEPDGAVLKRQATHETGPSDGIYQNEVQHQQQQQAPASREYVAWRPGAEHPSQIPATYHTPSVAANGRTQSQATRSNSRDDWSPENPGNRTSTMHSLVHSRTQIDQSCDETRTQEMAPQPPAPPPKQAEQPSGQVLNQADQQYYENPSHPSTELVTWNRQGRPSQDRASFNGNNAIHSAGYRKPVQQQRAAVEPASQNHGSKGRWRPRITLSGHHKKHPEAVYGSPQNSLALKPFKNVSENGGDLSTVTMVFSNELQKKEKQLAEERRLREWREEEIANLQRQFKDLHERENRGKEEHSKLQKRAKSFEQSKMLIAQQNTRIEAQEREISQKKDQIAGLHQQCGIMSGEAEQLRQDLESRNAELATTSSYLRKAQGDVQLLHRQNNDLQQDIARAEQEHNAAIQTAHQQRQELEDKLERECARLQEEKKAAHSRHEAEVDNLNTEHAKKLSRIESDLKVTHEKQTKQLKQTIASKDLRIASYSSSNGSYQPVHDSSFAQSLQGLSQQIRNLTVYVPRPDHLQVEPSLDPTKYLDRNSHHGNRSWQNFVRSVCWDIIIHGFFEHPLGFGSLGSEGEGFKTLLQFYVLFARLDPQDATSTAPVFPTDKETNMGRAWFFDGILKSVRANVTGDGFAAMFSANVSRVAEELINALQHISNGRLDSRAPAQIQDLTQQLGELALKMGSQRAQVFLEYCQYGDVVQPGERFTEEVESWGAVQVDLMIQPALIRIGDGREDLSSETIIAKGGMVSLKAGQLDHCE